LYIYAQYAGGKRGGNNVSLYSIRYAQHGDALIRVAHDEVLRWYMSLDGKKWATEKCSETLEWKLDKSTQAKVAVTPETVVRWHRGGFRLYWKLISKVRRLVGRRQTSKEVQELIFPDGR
jgi:hypothetical protein